MFQIFNIRCCPRFRNIGNINILWIFFRLLKWMEKAEGDGDHQTNIKKPINCYWHILIFQVVTFSLFFNFSVSKKLKQGSMWMLLHFHRLRYIVMLVKQLKFLNSISIGFVDVHRKESHILTKQLFKAFPCSTVVWLGSIRGLFQKIKILFTWI